MKMNILQKKKKKKKLKLNGNKIKKKQKNNKILFLASCSETGGPTILYSVPRIIVLKVQMDHRPVVKSKKSLI